MSENLKPSETNPPSTEAQKALHQLLGLPGSFIESPVKATSVLRLDDFWSKAVPGNLDIPKDKEIFLGFDFDNRSEQIVCTEITYGDADSFQPKRNHLVMLHTEPYGSIWDPLSSSKAAEFAWSLPQPYTSDMQFMLSDPSVYAIIILRLGLKNNPEAVLVAIRTQRFNNIDSKMRQHESKRSFFNEKHPIAAQLSEDKLVTLEGEIAIYRGFTSLPPGHDDILRLRKFQAKLN